MLRSLSLFTLVVRSLCFLLPFISFLSNCSLQSVISICCSQFISFPIIFLIHTTLYPSHSSFPFNLFPLPHEIIDFNHNLQLFSLHIFFLSAHDTKRTQFSHHYHHHLLFKSSESFQLSDSIPYIHPMATEKTMASPPPPAALSPPPSSSSSSYTSYPILAITIFGILTTAILLVSYYVFVIKCCMNGRHSDVIGRFSISRSRRHRRHRPPSTIYNTMTAETRGLGESAIRAIPTIRFRGSERNCVGKSFFHDCAICLSEFEEEERLRLLPNCAHAFHIDCIDTWLQTNANCPICRSDISRADPVLPPLFMAHCLHDQNTVIDVIDDVSHGRLSPRTELSIPSTTTEQQDPSPRKPDQRFLLQKKVRKLQHVSSMGDECIDVREKDEQFYPVQPIRRSISMDSSNDRKLYLAVQEILRLQQQPQNPQEEGSSSSTSVLGGSSRFRRTFFSFGYGRSSRNVVLPIQFERSTRNVREVIL